MCIRDSVHRDRPGDDEDVAPLVGSHRTLFRFLYRRARACHQRMVVVERDNIEYEVAYCRISSAQHAFDAARAFLQLQPYHTRALHRFERSRDARPCCCAADPQDDGNLAAELHEVAPRYTSRPEMLP